MLTKDDRITCAVCAWRATCAKKFSKEGGVTIHCSDFTRDLTIKEIKEEKKEEEKKGLGVRD